MSSKSSLDKTRNSSIFLVPNLIKLLNDFNVQLKLIIFFLVFFFSFPYKNKVHFFKIYLCIVYKKMHQTKPLIKSSQSTNNKNKNF